MVYIFYCVDLYFIRNTFTGKEIESCNADPKPIIESLGNVPFFKNKTLGVFHDAVRHISGVITLPHGSKMSKFAEIITKCGSFRDISHFISSSS